MEQLQIIYDFSQKRTVDNPQIGELTAYVAALKDRWQMLDQLEDLVWEHEPSGWCDDLDRMLTKEELDLCKMVNEITEKIYPAQYVNGIHDLTQLLSWHEQLADFLAKKSERIPGNCPHPNWQRVGTTYAPTVREAMEAANNFYPHIRNYDALPEIYQDKNTRIAMQKEYDRLTDLVRERLQKEPPVSASCVMHIPAISAETAAQILFVQTGEGDF